MKTPIAVVSLLFVLSGLMLTPLQAEPQGPAGGPGKEAMEKKKDMKAALNLSDEQEKKIDAIRKENREAVDAVKGNSSLSKEEIETKVKELRKTTHEKIKAVLTPEQQAKMEEMKKNAPGGPNAPKSK